MTNVWDRHALRAIEEWARAREIALRVAGAAAGLPYHFVVECAEPEDEIRHAAGLCEITTFANWVRFEQYDHSAYYCEYNRRVAEFNLRYPELTHVWS
jgi:hypothetical protein